MAYIIQIRNPTGFGKVLYRDSKNPVMNMTQGQIKSFIKKRYSQYLPNRFMIFMIATGSPPHYFFNGVVR